MTHESNNLFVYGTCLYEQYNHRILSELNFLGRGRIRGLLYDTGHYPALIDSDNDATMVSGELYGAEFLINCLHELDELVGYIPESVSESIFIRRLATVFMNGATEETYAYYYNSPVQGLPLISSGDYARYRFDSSTSWIFFFSQYLGPDELSLETGIEILSSQTGFLEGRQISFHKSENSGTLVSGITSSPGNRIFGILYRVFHQQMQERLTPLMTSTPNIIRTTVKVHTLDGKYAYADCFIPGSTMPETKPDREYIQSIIDAGKARAFPRNYTDFLGTLF